MTPSRTAASKAMTEGQIDKLADNVRAALRKVKDRFSAVNVQNAMERGQLDVKVATAVEMAVEQAIAEANNTIVRMVPKLDRSRKPQAVIDVTGRVQYADNDVVAIMPSNGTGVEENVNVEFFRLGRYVSDDELQREYEKRGLTPDPYAQSAVNEADPAFADEHPNGTHWRDDNNKWCFAAFDRCIDERRVYVNRYDSGWFDYWWFGGVRK